MEKWTQVDYYGFANLFARVSVKEDGDGAARPTRRRSSRRRRRHPAPAPRRGDAAAPARRHADAGHAAEDRRAYLARVDDAPANTLFARAVVNRVWANFFGRGLVHPFDDLRFTNPASNEPLFEAVTQQFVDEGFDVKALIRTS